METVFIWCFFGICLCRDRRNTRTEKNVSECFESKLGILHHVPTVMALEEEC